MSDFIDENLMKDYFEEAYTQIDIIEENILKLEKDTNNKDAVDALFRAAHTLKGGSATVQMNEIADFTHQLEDAMDEVRSDKVSLNPDIIDILLNALDIIKNMINARNNGEIYKEDCSPVINSLKSILNMPQSNQAPKKIEEPRPKKKAESVDIDKKFKLSEYDILELQDANTENLPVYQVIVTLDETNPMRTVGGIQLFTSLREIALILKTVPDFEDIYSDVFHHQIMYVIASSAPIVSIKDYSTIPDVTKELMITPLNKKNGETMTIKTKTEQKPAPPTPPTTNDTEEDSMMVIAPKKIEEEKPAPVKTPEKITEEKVIQEVKAEIKQATKQEIKQANTTAPASGDQKRTSASVLRVDSSRIDALLNLVSEIVINKATYNQISGQLNENFEAITFSINEFKDTLKQSFENILLFLENQKEDEAIENLKNEFQADFHNLYNKFDPFTSKFKSIISRFKSNNQNLDRISSSMQEGVMRVRMVPVKQIFNRFPRMVRDLSRNLKKDIELTIRGEETEIDKAMVDFLMDPLIHIVRNAIDHGIESPEDRKELGKPIPAMLELSAKSEGNIINIYVSDDGKGIDVDRIRKKAIDKHIITSDTILKDQDAYNLLFEPGFSTSENITNVSGRGVGLDVVKKNIEKLSGAIRVTSELGMGTTFSIKIPLTLAIIQGLMVQVASETYAIPISAVRESIRIKREEIKSIDNYEVINVRDDVLSLLRLKKLFKLGSDMDSEYYFVVIVGTGSKKIGILVDAVIGEEDIVIKPLKDKYTNTPGIAGATILGDGTVSLILDISQLIELGIKIEEESHLIK